MNRTTLLLTATLLLSCATRVVPDGLVTDAEWKSSQRSGLGEAGKISVLEAQATVRVALTAGNDGVASLFLFDGERVHVLHASAALGTAVFVRDSGGHWRNTQDFTWEARQPDDAAAREAFRTKHGWLANVTPPRPGQQNGGDREFVIDLAHFRKGERLRIAGGYLHLRKEGFSVDAWPAGLGDAVTSIPLHQGIVTGDYDFTPERWHPVGR